MKHRFFNRVVAKFFGYFWLPCPLCGEYFGGHEWRNYNGKYSALADGKGICPDCTKKGLGKDMRLEIYYGKNT